MCEAEIRELGVLSGLRSEGFNARPLLELTESGIGFDVLILGEPDLRELSSRANYSGVGIRPTVVLGNAAPAEIRPILDMGASAIIDPEISVAGLANLLRYIAEVERPIGILPLDSLMHIRGCLEDLPTAIGVEDQELLRLLTTFTIEEAGRSMGYSRRQIQRRFKDLRKRLGLNSHLHAVVAAVRWGLAEGRQD